MRAWVLHDVGDIRFEDVAVPVPQEREVCVRVKCAGICGSDVPRIYETGAHKMPLIPGHEFSGVVHTVGDGVLQDLVGMRVAVYPKISCGKCKSCLNGMPDMCLHYDYVGSRRDGAFAEYVTAPADNLMFLPDEVGFAEAAMLEPLAVAANAVRTGVIGRFDQDKPVAVCGLGTIGVMVVMLLMEAGYKNIYVIGNKESQMKRVCNLGIPSDRFLDANMANVSERLKDMSNGGVQAYFECVGKNDCISYGLDSAVPCGRVILVGNPYSDMYFSKDTYWQILRKQLHVCGIWNSCFRQEVKPGAESDDWNYVLERLANKKIAPSKLISHRFKIEEFERGIGVMKEKKEDYCKVMVEL
jgi:L-iditol 2-dehydrogenase